MPGAGYTLMHVGIDASRAATARRTGTEGYAYHLLQALLPLAHEHGHRITLYFNQPPAAPLFPPGPGIDHRSLPFPRLWTHVRLALELHRHPPDVFFTPAHVIPLSYRRASVATVHDLGYRFFPEAHTRSQVAYLEWSTRHNARRSHRVLADSLATREDLMRFYGITSHKIDVVYPGVDPALAPVRDPAQIEAVSQRYRLPDHYLLFLGTLQPRKNLVRLIQAYAASEVEPHLVLAGQLGWRSEAIVAALDALPPSIAQKVHQTGFVAEADKAALISGAVALLYPSLYEGFGFPILEAQACATPVLCALNSSQPEVAGEGALLVEAEDEAAISAGIRRLVADEALRQRLVASGRENAQRFTWEQAARQTLASLEEAARA